MCVPEVDNPWLFNLLRGLSRIMLSAMCKKL